TCWTQGDVVDWGDCCVEQARAECGTPAMAVIREVCCGNTNNNNNNNKDNHNDNNNTNNTELARWPLRFSTEWEERQLGIEYLVLELLRVVHAMGGYSNNKNDNNNNKKNDNNNNNDNKKNNNTSNNDNNNSNNSNNKNKNNDSSNDLHAMGGSSGGLRELMLASSLSAAFVEHELIVVSGSEGRVDSAQPLGCSGSKGSS
ncbi:unnamed protein product, partial [Polarella glacialis]